MSLGSLCNGFTRLLRNHPPATPSTRTVVRISANLGTAGTTANIQLPDVYYVIIGKGPMAVVNHITLRADRSERDRIGDKIVMHIGFPNPWPHYFKHGLGQPNHLLSFPGFNNREMTEGGRDTVTDSGLDSIHFGNRVTAEYVACNMDHRTVDRRKWVALIQKRDTVPEGDAAIGRETGGTDVLAEINEKADAAWPPFGEDPPDYRLFLYDPQGDAGNRIELVYASHIDICTGPGRPIVYPASGQRATEDQQIVQARTPPWVDPDDWTDVQKGRKTMNGVDAIRNEVTWDASERICITAGGGVGLNAAEKARNAGAPADWFGRTGLTPILLNPRNRTFLQLPKSHPQWLRFKLRNVENWHKVANWRIFRMGGSALRSALLKEGKAFALGERFGLGDLYDRTGISPDDPKERNIFPNTENSRMGQGAALNEVAEATFDGANSKVNVVLTTSQEGVKATIRDYYQKTSELNTTQGCWKSSTPYKKAKHIDGATTLYDRLVIPNGQNTNTVGQPSSFAASLFRGLERPDPIMANGRMVGLQTSDGCVRILGAASNNYPGHGIGDWQNDAAPAEAAAMWDFHDTLPKCAVPDGFIICAINTAVANGYFGAPGEATYNANINTMTEREVRVLLPDHADNIIFFRQELNGYEDLLDLIAVCKPLDREGLATAVNELRAATDVLREENGKLRTANRASRREGGKLEKANVDLQKAVDDGEPTLELEQAVAAATPGAEGAKADAVSAKARADAADEVVKRKNNAFLNFANEAKANRRQMRGIGFDGDTPLEFADYFEVGRYLEFVGDQRPAMEELAKLVLDERIRFAYPTPADG